MIETIETKVKIELNEAEMETIFDAVEILHKIGYCISMHETDFFSLIAEPNGEVLSVNDEKDVDEFALMTDAMCSFFDI